jgi:hypothetical protein
MSTLLFYFYLYIKLRVIHILFVVVALAMDFFVEFSMFISTPTLVVPIGTVAPLYHLNQ